VAGGLVADYPNYLRPEHNINGIPRRRDSSQQDGGHMLNLLRDHLVRSPCLNSLPAPSLA